MDKSTAADIEAAIKKVVEQIKPDVKYVEKYGGVVIVPDPDKEASFVGGIFSYKEHVSLEFSEGASFDDPESRLEGKGKSRRHLKLADVEQVESKDTKKFLKQALSGD